MAAAEQKVEEAKNELIEAHAAGADATTARKFEKALAAAQDTARLLADAKLAGVRRAAERAEADRVRFALQNYDGLVAERQPAAREVADAFERTMQELQANHARWRAMFAEMLRLAQLAGRDTHSIPDFPARLAELMRDVERAGGVNVPPPIPGGTRAARLIPVNPPPEGLEELAPATMREAA